MALRYPSRLLLSPAFSAPIALHHASTSRLQRRATCATASSRNLYADIGLPDADATTPLDDLKSAYRAHARQLHPDSEATSSDEEFSRAASAWAILSDSRRRAAYDAMGWPGVAALTSIEERGARARAIGLDKLDVDALALDADAGLLGSAAEEVRPPAGAGAHDDACPRSIEEALWNIEYHDDAATRYYGLWWVYRFRVKEAAPALCRLVSNSGVDDALRRRAALALGAVAGPPTIDGDEAVMALAGVLETSDYYLRYRAAEALASIARRHEREGDVVFPGLVMEKLVGILEKGRRAHKGKSGYVHQEGLFDLEALKPEVREKISAVFKERRLNERRARRTTMTPQLGVDEIDPVVDQPYEWIIKAVGAIANFGGDNEHAIEVVQCFIDHDIPLIRYAAHKALFTLTGDTTHAEVLIKALDYGFEHHYSQRVLIRDLGDLGYVPAAKAMADCPMVENSFKVLALKNMLDKLNNDPKREDVRDVLMHMDSLL